MPIIFWKNLLKCLPSTATVSEHNHRRLLPPPVNAAATPAAEALITKKNSSSLYDISSASTSKSLSTPSTYSFSSSDSDSDSPPDLSAIFASQRFFFSSPGRSNSIIEHPEPAPEPQSPSLGGAIAVKKFSPDPYADFKDSMREMIAARNVKDVIGDWEYLHELLACYLNLNPKHTHKIIISAFSDIVISLLLESEDVRNG